MEEGVTEGGGGVGPVAGIGEHVCSEVAGRGEDLAAGGAEVGSVSRMSPQMLHQVARLRERLAARRAYMCESLSYRFL